MINKYLKPLLGITLPNRSIEVSRFTHDFKIELIPQSFIDLKFKTIVNEFRYSKFRKS